jgi:hypothetical protein
MLKKRFNVYQGRQRMAWATGITIWNDAGLVFLIGADGRYSDTDVVV